MNLLTGMLRTLTGLALAPFASLPPIVALVFYSLLMGIGAAIAFRYTSNQKALKRVANQITASLLALRLYKDDTVTTFRAIGGLLLASFARLWYSLAPLAILLVPFSLILAQFGMYYEYRPLEPGSETIVSVRVDPERWDQLQNVDLVAPDSVKILARNRDAAHSEIVWKIQPTQPVEGVLSIAVAGDKVEKELKVADETDRLTFVNPLRPGPVTDFTNWLLHPGEPTLASGAPIQEFHVRHAANSTPLLGWDVHWVITVLIVSILGALIVAPWLKVQF